MLVASVPIGRSSELAAMALAGGTTTCRREMKQTLVMEYALVNDLALVRDQAHVSDEGRS